MLKFFLRMSFILIGSAFALYLSMGFLLADPTPSLSCHDFPKAGIEVSQIDKSYEDNGSLKVKVMQKFEGQWEDKDYFSGLRFRFSDNNKWDEILLGITATRKTRMEAWKDGELQVLKEKDFLPPINYEQDLTLWIEYQNHSNLRQKAAKLLLLKCFEGNHFFGDIGNLYVDLEGEELNMEQVKLETFQLNIQNRKQEKSARLFSQLTIWKNYHSAD